MNHGTTSSHEVAAADTQLHMIHPFFVSPLRGLIFDLIFILWVCTHSYMLPPLSWLITKIREVSPPGG
jgi:hypothetical protein